MLPEGSLAGRVALVTGGGTGLGRAMALELGRLGANVAVLGRRREPLDETVAALGGAGFAAVVMTRVDIPRCDGCGFSGVLAVSVTVCPATAAVNSCQVSTGPSYTLASGVGVSTLVSSVPLAHRGHSATRIERRGDCAGSTGTFGSTERGHVYISAVSAAGCRWHRR